MAKYAAAEAALHALDVAIQTHGGNGVASPSTAFCRTGASPDCSASHR